MWQTHKRVECDVCDVCALFVDVLHQHVYFHNTLIHTHTVSDNLSFCKDRKSLILGVWAAPGALETLPNGGGLRV